MKKIKLLLTALMLTLSIAGCSVTNSETEVADDQGSTATTEVESEETESSESEDSESEESETSDSTEASEVANDRFSGDYIITAEEMKEYIGDTNTIIIDARGSKDPHVESAISLEWGQLANTSDVQPGEEGWGHIYEPEEINPILSELGLDPSKNIILYSNTNEGWGEDVRILWQLDAYGYENLKMVDGGINAIKDAEIELTRDSVSLEPVEVSIEEIDDSAIINTDELVESYDDHVIIDARNKEEYEGATLYGEAQGGHLPGAINIQYIDLFNEDGYLKSNEEIDQMFIDAGIEKDDSIVVYCTGGIRSAYMQVIMEMLGYENAMNYQGSYYNWSASQDVE